MTRRAFWLFAAMSVIWGIPYLLIKVAVRDFSPASVVFLRTAIGASLLVPVRHPICDALNAVTSAQPNGEQPIDERMVSCPSSNCVLKRQVFQPGAPVIRPPMSGIRLGT